MVPSVTKPHGINSNTFASVNLVKDTPTTLVTDSGPIVVRKIVASGSGLMKVDVQWGTTGGETTKIVGFNSTSNPNVDIAFVDGADISGTETIKVVCTNLENSASPASDFAGYVTIFGHKKT